MKINAFLFDLDGTLFDAPYDWGRIRKELGVKGRLILEHFKTLSPEERRKKEKKLLSFEWEATLKGKLREGVRELLEDIKKRGKKIAIVTNNSIEVASYIIKKYSLPVDVVITREDGSFKPYREPIVQALERLEEKAESSVFVGDNDLDIMAAAGFSFPLILIVNSAPERFAAMFPDSRIRYFRSFHQLLNFIRENLL